MENYDLDETLYTGTAAGTYCDVTSVDVEDDGCTGSNVTVDGVGVVYIFISGQNSNSVIAFHAGRSNAATCVVSSQCSIVKGPLIYCLADLCLSESVPLNWKKDS